MKTYTGLLMTLLGLLIWGCCAIWVLGIHRPATHTNIDLFNYSSHVSPGGIEYKLVRIEGRIFVATHTSAGYTYAGPIDELKP